DHGVEVYTRARNYFSPRVRVRRRIPVRSITGYRVECVGYGKDPRVDVNLFAAQSQRVPAAVVFFMMLANDRSGAAQEVYALNDAQPVVDVLAHLFPLRPCQRPGLEKYRVAHTYLADVVKQRALF